MKIGIAYDLKPKTSMDADLPDDWHEEFDSPVTIEAISETLRQRGHTIVLLGNGRELLENLLQNPVDFVFNIAEGNGVSRTREARVPAICEMLEIPHSGSDPLTLSLALEKNWCRQWVEQKGITVPKGIVLPVPEKAYDGDGAEFIGLVMESELSFPLIAKPVFEGSSKGIRNRCLIQEPNQLAEVIPYLWNNYKQDILLEEFIEGDEVTVGIIGNSPGRILGCMRIIPLKSNSNFVYSLEVKRDWQEQVKYECPARLSGEILDALESVALEVFDLLGCRDITRIDFRIRNGIPYFLEANPLPGVNPESSDLVILAKGMGISYQELIGTIFLEALQRYGISETI